MIHGKKNRDKEIETQKILQRGIKGDKKFWKRDKQRENLIDIFSERERGRAIEK